MIIRGKNKSTGETIYLEYVTDAIIWNTTVYRACIIDKDKDLLDRIYNTKKHILNTIDGGEISVEDIVILQEYEIAIVHEEKGKKYYLQSINPMKESYRWTTDVHYLVESDLKRAREIIFNIYGNKDAEHILPYRQALTIANSLYLECK